MRPEHLDKEKCDLCGLCAEVCGRGIFEVKNGGMQYAPGGKCIDCGHCMAVCPPGALVLGKGAPPPGFDPGGLLSPDALMAFLRSRRSTRRFKPEAPAREDLEKLVEAARFAPTGTNKQEVKIAMVADPSLLETLRRKIMARYGEYEVHLAHPFKRFFLKTFVDRRLGDPAIRAYLDQFMKTYRAGGDPLFHRAPAAAFLYAGPGASTPKDDCVLALYHMVLMAERIGLGSCLLGTVEAAFARTPRLNDLLEIPRDQPVMASACFGYPGIRFKRLVERRPASVRWFT
jgi:nitroreductase/NAD-dependent dihydropyrimidine dehydrogenase PreA subunit